MYQRSQILENFIDITQCSRAIAIECLQNTNWNQEQALELFYESYAFRSDDDISSPKADLPVMNDDQTHFGLY